jgi:thiamine pyrophosphate-dependent acetolactate synthase large subunit-like protein
MMDTAEVMKVFNRHRGDAIVIPGRGGRHWIKVTTRPGRDLAIADPAMGGHASFSLGIALARPNEKVVLFDADGDVQMGMGALVTVAEQKPANFYHFMLDNGCYATTGGQPVPNVNGIAYDAIARACGYPRAYAFDNLETFSINLERILGEPGPVFVALKVRAEIKNEAIGARKPWRTRSWPEIIAEFRKEFGII